MASIGPRPVRKLFEQIRSVTSLPVMMTVIQSDQVADPWDQPSTSATVTTAFPVRLPTTSKRTGAPGATRRPVVPDDWDNDDDDDDDDDDDEPEQNTPQIWHPPNDKPQMPTIVTVIPTRNSAVHSVVPPPAALQAPMRILKRPSPNASPSSSSSSTHDQQTRQSLAEREARYQAARDRIFGQDASAGVNDPRKDVNGKIVYLGSSAIRNPRGPGEDLATGSALKGFEGRRKKGPVQV